MSQGKRKPARKKICFYDTTLRDGDQAEDINFSQEDKLRILAKLDDFGLDYIEGGWPAANKRDARFYREAVKTPLRNARLVAFGMTRRPGAKAGRDPGLAAILRAGVGTATLVGKSWDLHVREALRISYAENLRMIHESIAYLKKHLDEVFFDAEHFFDGYQANPAYAMKCIKAAEEAGADCIVLCDTNGGMLPAQIQEAVSDVRAQVDTALGIHTHNDGELAVANSLAAVEAGAVQVQGTINGYGERCGNANLCSIIPNLYFKMGRKCITQKRLAGLRDCSRFVAELANQVPYRHRPYVGESAFAHKGGIHVSAVARNPRTYEHIPPELVGNKRRILVSDLSGKATVEVKAKEFLMDMTGRPEAPREIIDTLRRMELQGYRYEGAEASFELLMQGALGRQRKFFRLIGFRVLDSKKDEHTPPYSEATIMIELPDGRIEHTAAEGEGPVNSLDNALRKALNGYYPQLKEMRLIDYKVRVLPAGKGTGSHVRVLIESSDGKRKWSTVGVSFNIIEASWQALTDAIDYKLQLNEDA